MDTPAPGITQLLHQQQQMMATLFDLLRSTEGQRFPRMVLHAYKAPLGLSSEVLQCMGTGVSKERNSFQTPKPPVDNLTQFLL